MDTQEQRAALEAQIELPPLPDLNSFEYHDGFYDRKFWYLTPEKAQDYARTAIEPYVKRIAELEAARIAYASEFPPNDDGDPDVGHIHENIRKLKAAIEHNRKGRGEPVAWKEIALDSIRRMRAGHVGCMDIVTQAETLLQAERAGRQPAEPFLWYRPRPGAEAHPDGRCYDIVFSDPHDTRFFPLYRNAPQPTEPVTNAHTDDDAVDHFAAAMKEKLAQARAKGRHGWHECDPKDLSTMLRAHVEKGDPRDVANFCMFLWSLGQPISAAPQPAEPVKVPSAISKLLNRIEQSAPMDVAGRGKYLHDLRALLARFGQPGGNPS